MPRGDSESRIPPTSAWLRTVGQRAQPTVSTGLSSTSLHRPYGRAAQVESLSLREIFFTYDETAFCQCHLRFMGLYYNHVGSTPSLVFQYVVVLPNAEQHTNSCTYFFLNFLLLFYYTHPHFSPCPPPPSPRPTPTDNPHSVVHVRGPLILVL